MSAAAGPPGAAGLPRVLVLSLGGTIAMGAPGQGGVTHSLEAGDLVAAVPALSELAHIEAVAFRQLPGSHLAAADVAALAATIDAAFETGRAEAAVVTQGTDTIEETSFLLELLGAAGRGAVVVTGAMRNPTLPGADGPANVLAAVATAVSGPAREGRLGVLVVMDDEVHAARFVAKTHTTSTAAFSSRPGPLGWLSEGRPILVSEPIGELLTQLPGGGVATSARRALAAGEVPLVPLLKFSLGDDGALAAAAARLGAAGLVVEGSGGGHVTPAAASVLGGLAKELPVVLASRTGAGATLRSTYGFEGGETDLSRRGLIGAGWLNGLKARLLLTALLAAGATRGDVADAFLRFA